MPDVQTFDAETNSLEVVMATGESVVQQVDPETGEVYDEVLDVAGADLTRLRNGAGVFVAHASRDPRAQIGVVLGDTVRVDGNQIVGRVELTRDPEQAGIVDDVRRGIRRLWSLGYVVRESTTRADGVRVVTRFEPYELSLVGVPADPATTSRSMSMSGTNQQQQQQQQQQPNVQQGAPVVTVHRPVVQQQQPPNLTTREASITQICASAGLSAAKAQQFIDSDLTTEQVFTRVLDARVRRQEREPHVEPVNVEFGTDQADTFTRRARESLVERMGVPVAKGAKPWDAGQYRGMPLTELARRYLAVHGQPTHGTDAMVLHRAMTTRSGNLQTTSDFPSILNDAANISMQAAYALAPQDYRRFCGTREVPDFRMASIVRIGGLPGPKAMAEHSEFEFLGVPDGERVEVATSPRGGVYGLTRQSLIDDRINAFGDFTRQIADAAARALNAAAYEVLQGDDGTGPMVSIPAGSAAAALFSAARHNLTTSAGLSAPALNVDAATLSRQTDVSGRKLDLRPVLLLVETEFAGQARAIIAAEYVANTAGTSLEPNPGRGVVPEVLGTSHLEGSRRYLFADPNAAPVLTVAYLDPARTAGLMAGAVTGGAGGGPAPVISTLPESDFDGLRWKVIFDWAIQAQDSRGAVYNAGV